MIIIIITIITIIIIISIISSQLLSILQSKRERKVLRTIFIQTLLQ